MSDNVIEVRGLAKQYRLGVVGSGWLYKDLQSWWARLRGGKSVCTAQEAKGVEPSRLCGDSLMALSDIDFSVHRGEVVGVVGRNGAGKSTLLKILTRVTAPSAGTVRISGRVASLLEVGTGFHPELTGRENIYLNGAILGMNRAEVRAKFDEIVSFAEMEPFVDTPVKRYSSGMYVRLAFSVAAHLDAEIMLIDEVLAVGDSAFRRKCLNKLSEVAGDGRTVLFVSHNMSAVQRLCGRALFLDGGRLMLDDTAEKAVDAYLGIETSLEAVAGAEVLDTRRDGLCKGEPFFRATRIALVDREGEPRADYRSDEPVRLVIDYDVLREVPELNVIVQVETSGAGVVLRTESADRDGETPAAPTAEGRHRLEVEFPEHTFGERQFTVNVSLIYLGVQHEVFRKVLGFDVRFMGYGAGRRVERTGDAAMRPLLHWRVPGTRKEGSA